MTLKDFRVEKLLGRGGMGEVYLATQLSLNRPVALKVLRADVASNRTYLSRLQTEAMAVAKLNHTNIVHVYTFDCVGNIHFIAMEYVQGTNLRQYIVKKGALDLPLAFSIMRQTGQAIGAAGEIGLVHRDIKPENILMTRTGRVKVADFGLCRDLETSSHLTQSGVTMGTPLYMAPEQAQGHAIDHRSDLYSLGVTFYHMLTGVAPFRADTALALALKHVREAPRSMLLYRPDLPVDLDRLVLKLMAKDPTDRYQSAAEMLADLSKIRDSLAVATTPSAGANASQTAAATVEELQPPVPEAEERRDRARVSTLADLDAAGGPPGPAAAEPARLNWGTIALLSAACLAIGAAAGWTGRQPDVQSLAAPAAAAPALWLEPRWASIPKQDTAEEQYRFAQFQAQRDDWVPAFLAVPGYFPHARELVSKAYCQLARIYYRRCDLDALAALESDLAGWKEKQTRDSELVDVIRIALKLRRGDLEGVVEGMKSLTKNELSEFFDPALVEMSLEICLDTAAPDASGLVPVARETLQPVQRQLIWQLFRIEVHGRANAARAPQKNATKAKK